MGRTTRPIKELRFSGRSSHAPEGVQIVDKTDSRKPPEFLRPEGPFLLPMVERITRRERAAAERIDGAGQAPLPTHP